MNPIPKVELRLNEENELSFKMSIEGTTSDPKSKPKFRFLVTDFGSDKGIVYPCTREPNDVIKVLIPGLKENYNIGKKYLGKLEVILGSLYFTPTELLISFKEPLKIKAAPVTVTAAVDKDKSTPSEPIDSDEELEDEEYDEDEDIEEEEESDEEDTEEDNMDDDSSEEDMEDEDIEEEDAIEEEELMEKPEYREEYHQLTSEDKINLDEFFISDSAPISQRKPVPPEAVSGIEQIVFAPPAPKSGTVLLAPGFEGVVPERVQKTFTASGLPESSTISESNEDSFQESKLSKAATAAKNNLKKAFLEALTHNEEPQQKSAPAPQPIKEAVTKNKDTLEEAKRLLMSAAEENRKKKINVNAKVANVSVARPKSLKDLFSKDFLD
jgi:hypothetical protein